MGHDEASAFIARQVSVYLNASSNFKLASLAYQSDSVALFGMANLMKVHGNKNDAMAIKLMQYHTKRGGTGNMGRSFHQKRQGWCFQGMYCGPEDHDDYVNHRDAGEGIMRGLMNAMEQEELVYKGLNEMYERASDAREHHLAFFIQSELLNGVLDSIHELSVITTRFSRIAVGPDSGQGIHMFDRDLLDSHEVHLL